MAWGLWNKIKQGFKKVGNFVKKAASFVNEKVIKPFKPVITNVANAIAPGSGKIVEAISDGVDAVANGNLRQVANSNLRQASNRIIGMPNPNARPYKKLNM